MQKIDEIDRNNTPDANASPPRQHYFNTDTVDEQEGKSFWFAFADADTGNPVYFNQKTGERTWKKPNKTFQFVDGTMPSGLSGDPEQLGADYQQHPYMAPSEEHARLHAKRQIFEQGNHPFFQHVNFSSLGVGVKGYFMMLQFLIVMFFVLSLIVSPLIYSYSQGQGLGTLSSSFGLGTYTVGNIQSSISTTGIPMAFIWGEEVPLVPDAAEYISWTVFVVASVFFVGWLVFSISIQKMASSEDAATCAIDDYTVVVWNLPSDACESEIAVHFSNLYNLQHVDWCCRIPPAKLETKKQRELHRQTFAVEHLEELNIAARRSLNNGIKVVKTRYKRGSIIGQIGNISALKKSIEEEQKQTLEAKRVKEEMEKNLPNPLFYPTSHSRNIKTDDFKGMWISDLSVGHPNGALIRSFNEHAELVQQLRIQRAMYKKYRSNEDEQNEQNEQNDQNDLKKKEKYDLLADKALYKIFGIERDLIGLAAVHKSNKHRRRDPEDVVNAYVTFNNQESFRRCYEDYANTRRTCCTWRKIPLPLLFNGEYSLKVDRAPDPSDILWENLEATDQDILKKKCMTRGATSSLLLLCFVIVFTAFFYANEFSTLINNEIVCDVMLPSIHYTLNSTVRTSIEHQYHTTKSKYPTFSRSNIDAIQKERDHQCQQIDAINFQKSKTKTNSLYYDVRYLSNWTMSSTIAFDPPIYNISVCKTNWCNTDTNTDTNTNVQRQMCPCVEVSESLASTSSKSCKWKNSSTSLNSETVWNGREIQNCYCAASLSNYLTNGGNLGNYILKERSKMEGGHATGTDTLNGDNDSSGTKSESTQSFCARFGYLFVLSRGLMVASVSMVSVLNILLEEIVKVVATWEHSHTLSAQSAAIMSKVFIGIYLNTAFILIVVNQKIPGINFSRGQHEGFTPEWYGKIGASLSLTMLMDIFVPHLMPTATMFIVKPMMRKITKLLSPDYMTPIVTQKQINDLYLGMEFELPIRVAYVLNTVSIAITFVSGIPLMLVFATVSLCLSYLVDRWMLLRYYNKGVIFDDTILRETWNLIPYVAIISLAMSIYMLTEISIFPPIEDQRASTALLMFGMANSTDGDVSWLNARLARSWSFPLFTLMFVSVICLIFKVILSQFISNAVDIDVFRAGRGFMAGCCCTFQFNVVKDKNGKNKDGNNENDDIDDIDDIDDEFNAYYKKMKPAFTELCIKKIDKVGLGKDMISDRELEERWTIVRHRVTQTLYKAKVWKTDGISRVSGIQHRKGEIMRTYDDISLTRLATYNIKGNPRYRAAVRGLHLVAKRREDYIKHHGDTDGLHHATSQKHLGMKNVARGESSRLMKAGRIGEMFSPRTVDAKARELRRRSDMNRHVRIHQARGGAQRKTQHWDRKSEIKYE